MEGKAGEEDFLVILTRSQADSEAMAKASGCGFPLHTVPGCPCKISCSLYEKNLIGTSRSMTETEGQGCTLKETQPQKPVLRDLSLISPYKADLPEVSRVSKQLKTSKFFRKNF